MTKIYDFIVVGGMSYHSYLVHELASISLISRCNVTVYRGDIRIRTRSTDSKFEFQAIGSPPRRWGPE